MTVHLTKRVEVYCDDNQSSIFVEQENEFDGVDIVLGEAWTGDKPFSTTLSKEVAKGLVEALQEVLEEKL